MKTPLFSFLILLIAFSLPPAPARGAGDPGSTTLDELLLYYEKEELFISNRQQTPVRQAPAIASVITDQEIRHMGARNLLDILKTVPAMGVSIGSLPLVRSVEMRGIRSLHSEKILLMIDGHRVNDALLGTAMTHFGSMSVECIKRVEVIRGPGSALYGANAFLGVVNVVTKGAEDIHGLETVVGGGSFDTRHAGVLFGHSGEKGAVSFFFDYLDTDGPSSFIARDAVGNSGNTRDWREKKESGFNISRGGLTLRGRYQDNENGPYIGTAAALNDETVIRYGNWSYLDLAYRKEIFRNTDIMARMYADYVDIDNYFEIFSEGFPGYPRGMIGNPSGKQRMLGGELTLDYRFADHRLTSGVTYENADLYDVRHITNFDPLTNAPLGSVQDISDWGNFSEETSRDIWAVYFQDVWNINDRASLTVGLRHDHYSDFGGSTNPRAGFVWEFLDNSTLKILYGSAFRAPNLTELYQKNNPSKIGNPDLEPEKIRTYEAGIEQHIGNSTLRLDYFYSRMKDLIVVGDKPSVTEPATSINQGEAEVEGLEAELTCDFKNGSYCSMNYCYQHPTDGKTGRRLPDVPSHRANLRLNYTPWKYLNTNLNLTWVGRRPRDDQDSRPDLSSATLVDVTLIARNFYKTLEIRGSVYNLFDEDYRDPSPYPVQVPGDYPANKRMFLLEVRYVF